jgi:hypothetical protein
MHPPGHSKSNDHSSHGQDKTLDEPSDVASQERQSDYDVDEEYDNDYADNYFDNGENDDLDDTGGGIGGDDHGGGMFRCHHMYNIIAKSDHVTGTMKVAITTDSRVQYSTLPFTHFRTPLRSKIANKIYSYKRYKQRKAVNA